MKTCTKCGEVKPTTEFYKDASKRDGLRTRCRACENVADAVRRAANKDRKKEYDAAYCVANTEKKRSQKAAWAAAHPDKVKASKDKWCAANMDRVKAVKAVWNAANRESSRMYWQNRRARKIEAGGSLSHGLAERLFKHQRGKCACGCKQPLGDDYHLDHIMPLALGGTNTDDNIQLLTAICNRQKAAKHPIDFMQQRGFLL